MITPSDIGRIGLLLGGLWITALEIPASPASQEPGRAHFALANEASAVVTDSDIFSMLVFEEPLIALGGDTSTSENAALREALRAHAKRQSSDDYSHIHAFLHAFPRSPWRAALLTNIGLEYRRTGWFLKALASWEEAWRLSKEEQSPAGKALADRALGELAELNARVGRRDRVEALLKEVADRPLLGSVTEKIAGAREGVWLMQNEPGKAFKCGPLALDSDSRRPEPGACL